MKFEKFPPRNLNGTHQNKPPYLATNIHAACDSLQSYTVVQALNTKTEAGGVITRLYVYEVTSDTV